MKNLLLSTLIIICMTGCHNPFAPSQPPDLTDLAGTWQMAGLSTGTYELESRKTVDDPWTIDVIDAYVADRAIWVITPDAITIFYGEPGMDDVPAIPASYTMDGDALVVTYTRTSEWEWKDMLIMESYGYALSCDLSDGGAVGVLEVAGPVEYVATYEPEMYSQNTGGMLEFAGELTLQTD